MPIKKESILETQKNDVHIYIYIESRRKRRKRTILAEPPLDLSTECARITVDGAG